MGKTVDHHYRRVCSVKGQRPLTHAAQSIKQAPVRWPRILLLFTALPVLAVLLSGENAWALQTHGGAEGLVVHQLAHLQYLGALGYLLWDIRRSSFSGLGWQYLQWFCGLMMLWNAVAFAGHFAQLALPESALVTDNGYLSSVLIYPEGVLRWLYLSTSLDHLFITPGLFCLFLAMRTLYLSLDAEKTDTVGEET
jgi:hypothetical protein